MSTTKKRPNHDAGSVSAEVVLLAPLAVVLLLFVAVIGRVVLVRIDLDAAAYQAARAASIERTSSAAMDAAQAAAEDSTGSACLDLDLDIDLDGLEPGGTVTVTLTCEVAVAEFPELGDGGPTHTLTATAAAGIDPWRSP